MRTKLIRSTAAIALLVAAAAPAFAQATRVGATFPVISAMSRGSAIAYGQGVYLVVSAMGTLNGRFVSADGVALGSTFPIATTGQYAVFPRVAFSPDADGGAGGFLVTWSESATPIQVHARMVSYSKGGAYGLDTVVGYSSSFEAGCAVAYSTGSQEFLVVWKNEGTLNIDAVRVGNSANLLGVVAFPQTPDGERDPSVAYNPDDNQFLVVYSGWNSASAFVAARRVQSGTGVVIDGAVTGVSDNRILLMTAGGTYITDVTYNRAAHKYLASWFALNASLGQIVNRDGSLSGGIITLSTYWKAYDGLSVAYNPLSGTSFLVSHSSTVEDGGVEIRGDSQPVDNGIPVTAAGGSGNFYPRVAANPTRTDWMLSTANSFTSTMAQLIHTATTSCVVTVSPSSFSIAGGGGTGTIVVTDLAACAWAASSSAPWLTITSGATGTATGSVTFSAAPNGGAPRSATITIGTQVVTVTQTGCSFSISPPAISLPAGGGRNLSFNVTAGAGCSWTAQSAVPWIATSSTGTGSGTVLFTAVRNPNPSLRGGQISVGGLYYLVFEAGATVNDLNDDGRPDILFQNNVTGEVTTWSMYINQQLTSAGLPQEVDLNWRISGVADMDRDGQSDVIWHNTATGANRVWLMDGSTLASEVALPGLSPAALTWNVVGSGDFDADGTPDIVWQDDLSGQVAVWMFSRAGDGSFSIKTTRSIATVPTNWKVRGVADFNRDLIPDLVWQDTTSGAIAVWFMGPGAQSIRDTRYFMNLAGTPYNGKVATVDPNWRIVGVGDFNNDLRADLIWQHPDGWLAMWLTWDNVVLDTRWLVNSSGTPIRFMGLNLNWRIAGPK